MIDQEFEDALEPMFGEGWIDDVLFQVKSGKEATVLCCRGGERAGGGLVAAKIYRPREHRGFANDAMYRAGRVQHARNSRVSRAIDSGSAFGREAHFAMWIGHELEMLSRLASAGLPVPAPIASTNKVIVMPFIGDINNAAPRLSDVNVDRADAERVTELLLNLVVEMLHLHVVHADLSPYNVLYWKYEPVIIDLPQAVDPRLNPAASELLHRDIQRICDWARTYGAEYDATGIYLDLWREFREGRVG